MSAVVVRLRPRSGLVSAESSVTLRTLGDFGHAVHGKPTYPGFFIQSFGDNPHGRGLHAVETGLTSFFVILRIYGAYSDYVQKPDIGDWLGFHLR